MTMCRNSAFLALFVVVAACSRPTPADLDSKDLTPAQSLADFDALASTMRSLYGPRTYKEHRYNYTLENLISATRAQVQASTGDRDTFAALEQFLARFHDGHISMQIPGNASKVSAYVVPVYLTPVAGHALVALVQGGGGLGIQVGDEVLSIDGQKPFDLLPTILKYQAFARDASDQHWIMDALRRPFYIKELVPTKQTTHLQLARADGTTYEVELPWTERRQDTPSLPAPSAGTTKDFTVHKAAELFDGMEGSLLTMGATAPFFSSPEVRAAYDWTPVTPSDETLTKYGLTRATMPDIFAVTYTYKSKKILLVRQPGYEPTPPLTPDLLINGYRAILDEFQAAADVLVVDQTHNPGGDLDYALAFFSLFEKQAGFSLVQHLHADRKWVYDMKGGGDQLRSANRLAEAAASYQASTLVEQAIDAGTDLTAPVAITGLDHVAPDAKVTWGKPLLVLADELAGSCGDIFPMLIKRNGIAKVFGQTTMGLGGNVEPAVTLPNSQASVNLTRGLYTTYRVDGQYSDADLVENVGIDPDIPYQVSVADFRAGFVDYVKSFSDAAIAQTAQ